MGIYCSTVEGPLGAFVESGRGGEAGRWEFSVSLQQGVWEQLLQVFRGPAAPPALKSCPLSAPGVPDTERTIRLVLSLHRVWKLSGVNYATGPGGKGRGLKGDHDDVPERPRTRPSAPSLPSLQPGCRAPFLFPSPEGPGEAVTGQAAPTGDLCTQRDPFSLLVLSESRDSVTQLPRKETS